MQIAPMSATVALDQGPLPGAPSVRPVHSHSTGGDPSGTGRRLRSPWVIGPVFDLLFIAGGIPIVLIVANVLSTGWLLPEPTTAEQKLLLGVVLVGQHLFANSHNIATYLRIWGSTEDRERFRFHRTWLVVICLGLFAWGTVSEAATGVLVYIFLMAVFWHYAAQSYGVALIYCYKRNYILRPIEKRLMRLCITSLSAFAILRILSFREFSPMEWYGVPMPFWGPLPPLLFHSAAILFSLSVLGFCGVVVLKLIREGTLFPLPSLMVLVAVITMGLSGRGTNAVLWFYIPPFFHGTQYLAIYLTYALKERGEEGPISLGRLLRSPLAGRLFATTIAMGFVLYIGIPTLFEQFGFNYAMIGGLVLATVSFHHFLTDAAIWKLRDPRCRELLLA